MASGNFPTTENEQQSHSYMHTAVYHTYGRTEKATDNKQHTRYK